MAGVELYFDNLDRAKGLYRDILGMKPAGEESGRHAKLAAGASFVCLERRGSESYPSRDKAVLFFEVEDLAAAVEAVGRGRFVQVSGGWAVLPEPEGHHILLLQR